MNRKPYISYILFSFLLFSIACQPKKNIIYMSNHNFDQEVSQAKYSGLLIQEGDILDIMVSAFDPIAVRAFNRSTMNQTDVVDGVGIGGASGGQNQNVYQVDPDGNVNLPVLGNVFCKGMTKNQLKTDIENRLKVYLTEPYVTVKLTNLNFSVLGAVGNPGSKTSPTEKINIFQAIALAGDISDSGNKTNVKIIRSSRAGTKDEVVTLNLSEANIVNSPYYYIQQNDVLYVEPDKNRQIEANTNANVDKVVKYSGFALGLIAFILTLTRL